MREYTEAFRPLDLKEFNKSNRHKLDWRSLLKDVGQQVYSDDTTKNPKCDARLVHNPLPSMRIQNKIN
jgi:hypothetical protein